MNRSDFLRLIGTDGGQTEYVPVACLLRGGYGCAGYYNANVNDDLSDTCVLVNARIVDLSATPEGTKQGAIQKFRDFIEEIVMRHYKAEYEKAEEAVMSRGDNIYGPSIPLAAIPFAEIAVLYPVARIGTLMQRSEKEVPTFLDFDNKSAVLKVLRTKLW